MTNHATKFPANHATKFPANHAAKFPANHAANSATSEASFQRLRARHACGDILIYVCHNCLPANGRLPRQWSKDGAHVRVEELPCTGKIGTQYLFHALEGGSAGICVVTCPKGECTLFEGNYRAEMRVNNVKSLLEEIGMASERVKIFSFSPQEPIEELKRRIDAAVNDFIRLPAGAATVAAAKKHEAL
jgi:coenzyme F420-reducing hydrogenase delta subunit